MFARIRFWVFIAFAALAVGIYGSGRELSAPVMREAPKAETGGIQNVLILGHDESSGLTDTLMLASFDRENKSLMLYQIPRDTYFASHTGNYKKINGACAALGSSAAFADALAGALGVEIDGYVEFSPDFVKAAVDLVGGVTLELPCDMDYDDPAQGLSIHLKKGVQRLDGEQAIGFVRFRSGYASADLGRIDAQKQFLAAFARSFAENIGSADIPGGILLGLKYIKTDMRVGDLAALAFALRELAPERMTVLTLPGEAVCSEKSGAWYYILSKEGCRALFPRFDPQMKFTDPRRTQFHEIYKSDIRAVPHSFADFGGAGDGQKGTQ